MKRIGHGKQHALRSADYDELYRSDGIAEVFLTLIRAHTTLFGERFLSLAASRTGFPGAKIKNARAGFGSACSLVFSVRLNSRFIVRSVVPSLAICPGRCDMGCYM